ncbi:hypothetical protein AVEN_182929-1, partial [Araneus ventricosus]
WTIWDFLLVYLMLINLYGVSLGRKKLSAKELLCNTKCRWRILLCNSLLLQL